MISRPRGREAGRCGFRISPQLYDIKTLKFRPRLWRGRRFNTHDLRKTAATKNLLFYYDIFLDVSDPTR